ncbi:MAG TPA: hypothetical protein VF721_19500 [Pyrinomonadaceae bacterium]|jgi:hypothetical protein
MKKLIAVFVSILLSNSIAFACSMAQMPQPPISAFNHKLYVFVGEVVGHTEIIKSNVNLENSTGSDKFYGDGRGIKIKPVEVINLPEPAGDYLEFFKFGVTTWCAPQISDLSRLPVGTRLRIIAYETSLLPNRSPENKIRLESKIFDRFSMVGKEADLATTADSVFDYKNWKSTEAKIRQSNIGNWSSFDDFVFMEISKDLLRLEKAKSKKERYAILERLLYAPGIDYYGIVHPQLQRYPNYSSLLQMKPGVPPSVKNVKLTSTEKRLLKQRDEIEKSGYFNFKG